MKHVSLVLLLLCCASTFADDHPTGENSKPAVLMDGLGNTNHPVSTKNAEAQKFFDQGLRLIYAFNHDEARRAFQRAAELDPQLGMAHWGMALAVGPNYNLDAQEAQLKEAYASIQKALMLAKSAPAHERDYIEALAKRYAADPKTADKKKQALAYKEAMGALAKSYPDDLDAVTLYAESAMNLRPWELWSLDGKPAEGTEEILAVLDDVLRRKPDHPGACHYYIHAIEASPFAERGLTAADRLRDLAPAAGHLVHMPSHIYIRVGDYAAAALANEKAAEMDRQYIDKFKVHGIYPMMYYSHNLHFLAVAHAMQGRYADAKKAADRLVKHVGPHVKDMPMLEFFLPTPILIDLRFARWNDILATDPPDKHLVITRAIWHFARGSALAAKGNSKEALGEHASLVELAKSVPDDMKYAERNLAKDVFIIPAQVLAARVALASRDFNSAIDHFQKALEVEDKLSYMEPADWYLPVREALGAALLQAGKATEAEKVFRADLARNRRNPRSLFGLMESLKAQDKGHAAQCVRQQFEDAWRNAEPRELRIEDF